MTELATIIGIILALLSIGVAMVLKGANPQVLVNPAAFMIIFAGTLATLFVAFPMKQVKKIPALLKIALLGKVFPSKAELIRQMVEYANLVRREGLLALDSVVETVEEPFVKKALTLATTSHDSEDLARVLESDIESMKQRHRTGATVFSQAGTYAPSLGVLGAVIGLIAALGNLNDIEKLGHSIAAAFVATLLGIFTGYVVWHPLANKMKVLSHIECEIREMILVGVLCILRGENAFYVEQEMMTYLSPQEVKEYSLLKEKRHHDEEKPAQ